MAATLIDTPGSRGRLSASSTVPGMSDRSSDRSAICPQPARQRSSTAGSTSNSRPSPGCSESELLLRVEQDRDRALVHQFDLHHLLEPAGLAAQACIAYPHDEMFVEFPCTRRRSGVIERRPLAATDVSVERELRNHQHRALALAKVEIHLAVLIVEDAKADDLLGEVLGIGLAIALAYAEKNEQPIGDFSCHLARHRHPGTADALDNGSNENSPVATCLQG